MLDCLDELFRPLREMATHVTARQVPGEGHDEWVRVLLGRWNGLREGEKKIQCQSLHGIDGICAVGNG